MRRPPVTNIVYETRFEREREESLHPKPIVAVAVVFAGRQRGFVLKEENYYERARCVDSAAGI